MYSIYKYIYIVYVQYNLYLYIYNLCITHKVRGTCNDSYGRGNTMKMRFADFIKRFSAGDPTVYLTTQKPGVDLEGRQHLMAPPVRQVSLFFSFFFLELKILKDINT